MQDIKRLIQLQKNFCVSHLGGGDATVGFNVLTSMACTLANLMPADGLVVYPDKTKVRLGTSLLVLGSASAGNIVDQVISEVIQRQNNLSLHLENYFQWLEEDKRIPFSSIRPDSPGVNHSADIIMSTQCPFEGNKTGGYAKSWKNALDSTPVQSVSKVAEQGKFLLSVSRLRDVQLQLPQARQGCPLVHLGFSDVNDLGSYSDFCPAFLEGRYVIDASLRTSKGNIIATDPMGVVSAAAENPDDRSLWLGKLLWLTDGGGGPELPEVTDGKIASHPMIEEKFNRALTKIMTYRFSSHDLQPIVLSTDVWEASVRWTDFLKKMEPRLPGISGATRNLLASLAFGLQQFYSKIPVRWIEAMAQFLVYRMANARVAMLRAGELAKRRSQISRIFDKLGREPVNQRKISADLGIRAVDRDEAIRWMSKAGLVYQEEGAWHLHEGAQLNFSSCAVPILEV